jgi:U3 small nucleolar RNA-associated protein 14
MPARVARSSLSAPAAKAPKKKNKSAKRSLNAFAIAEAIEPEKHKIRRSRLGQVEDDGPRPKRRRTSDDEDEDEDDEPQVKRRARRPGDDDEGSEQSDDEGNRWRMGVVEDDDDSDIDSDEAFGESDEEKFEGWTFRGGSGGTQKKSKPKRQSLDDGVDMTLEESEEDDSDGESLGSDAVDLATMLDNYEPSDEEGSGSGSEDENDDDQSQDGTPPSDYSMSDDEDEEDVDRAARLAKLVTSLQPAERAAKKAREAELHESKAPSAAGVVSSEKFDINDFLASTSDAQLKKVSKELGSLPKASKKDLKLAPSLPKRQKDRLERIAANEKAKQTLERWVDTVKHQRRAEHLSFPIIDPNTAKPEGGATFTSGSQFRPSNDLEAAIQSIMQESGLASGRKDEEEQKLLEFEELQANKLPLEEVQARRAELRQARDLLFREEVRAKRIKKIKSKAFRRIKRKEREKLAALDRDAFAEGMDGEMDDEEREAADRRRAEERMRLKHKDSKWAKQMKQSGRTTWDDEAITGVTEMAKKSDELRRRIEGKDVRDSDASGDEILSTDEDDEASDIDDDAVELQQLRRQVQRAEEYGDMSAKANKLAGLGFMQRAEARKRQENQETIEQMRRELNGELSGSDEDEEETIGRKIFAPHKPLNGPGEKTKEVRGEFEERDSDAGDDVQIITEEPSAPSAPAPAPKKQTESTKPSAGKSQLKTVDTDPTKPSKKKPSKAGKGVDSEVTLLHHEQHSQPDAEGWVTVTYNDSEDEADQAEATEGGVVLDQAEILRRAFAGDDVAAAFEAEKDETMREEDDQVIDNTLPGWGSWVGTGLSKRDKKKRAPHASQLQKIAGIRPDKRKDAKLKDVIINQKRNKLNAKYLATELPHVYGTKTEYERSIRMPVGAKWNTMQTYEENVKPRVLVKPGSIVRPMEKPLV